MNQKDIVLEQKIANEIKQNGGRMFRVGGIVRDKLYNEIYPLNTPVINKDLDTETYGISVAEFKNILSKYGKVELVGESFGVFKIHGYDIDFSLPRKEKATGTLHTDFNVTVDPFMSYKEASKRRDFTINQFMQDCLTNEIIDSYNGMNDLKNGVIRHINDNTFQEDSLRIFRAAGFASRFQFKIASETLTLCKSMDISSLSKERIEEEILKIFRKSKKPSIFFENLIKMNIIEKMWDWSDFETECNIYLLDELASLNLPDKEGLMLTLLFSNYGHYLSLLEKRYFKVFSNKQYYDIMIHNIPYLEDGIYNLPYLKQKEQRLFLSKLKYPDKFINCISILQPFLKEKLEAILQDYNKNIKKPLITGQDLIYLGFKPSPKFKELLNKALELQCENLSKEQIIKTLL